MRKCKCGNDVANNARFCPKCGHRFTSRFTKFMAWTCVVLFGFVILVAIIASNSSGPQVSSASPVVAATQPPTPAKPAKPKTPAQIAADQIAARKAYAKVIDQQLLDMGIESETYTAGAQARTLVIKDALAGRVRQNGIQKNDQLFDNLRTLGFTRLEYTNGFDSDLSYDVYWTIK
jgi:uncharacterized iron-regulated membrane protein